MNNPSPTCRRIGAASAGGQVIERAYGGATLTIRTSDGAGFAPGAPCGVVLPPSACRIYDAAAD